MTVSADLVFPVNTSAELSEVCSWDGVRPATLAPSEFPVDVVRLAGSSSPPLVLSRARRAETLKALPATLRSRAHGVFERAAKTSPGIPLAHGRRLELSTSPAVMAVVNTTPDSFSDGGRFFDAGRASDHALRQLEAGAAIVDIGGESTRPSSYGEAVEVPEEEEIRRVVPVIERVRRQTELPISVDTRKAAVAREALAAGADLVNDVTALRYDPRMGATIVEAGAAVILMHMRGVDPRTMQQNTAYAHPVAVVATELAESAERAQEAGILASQIVLDPGLGFGKTLEGNLVLLRYLVALRGLGFPLAVGASRKGFVRRFSGVDENSASEDRLAGSLACLVAAVSAGAAIVRVHDAAESVRFLKMLLAIRTPASPAAQTAEAAIR